MKRIFFCLFVLIATPSFAQEHKIKPIKHSQVVKGTGHVNVVLDTERIFNHTSTAHFYQGVVRVRDREFPASASKINGVLKINFPGKITGSRASRQRFYSIRVKSSGVRVSSTPSSLFSQKECASHTHDESRIMSKTVINLNSVYRIVTISTYADPEFQQIYGSSTNDEILSIINSAEVVYKTQLGIKFKVISQSLLQNSTPELSPSDVLSVFNKATQTDTANLKHLFTGKDMNGTTVGIAYISAICYAPNYAHGVTQNFGYYTANIFAHEVGHNLGAQHDLFGFGTLMYPTISLGEVYFSTTSLNQIESHLLYFGSCLTQETEVSPFTGATITFKKHKRTLYVKLIGGNGVGINDEMLVVKMLGTTKNRLTSKTGVVPVILTKRGSYTIKVYSLTHPNITSRIRVSVK